jgi:hypothetical protein
VRSAGGARAAGQQESGCIVTVARITEHIRRRASEWPPSSSRLDVGTEALAVLRAAIPPAEPPPYEPWGSVIGHITGLSIVGDAELDPLAWRLFDHEGQVMDSGTMA